MSNSIKKFPIELVLRHERLHAAGYDHIGSKNMLRMLQNWKAKTALSWLADDM